MNHNIEEYMHAYLGQLKATEMWLHAAHHVTKGPGFISDHRDLYGVMYTKIGDHFDLLVEKSIGLSGDESVACPLRLSLSASHILNKRYMSPVNKPAYQIVKEAIGCLSDQMNALSSLYQTFEKSGYMTLGMEDALTSMANEYEGYLYFLGQRYKN